MPKLRHIAIAAEDPDAAVKADSPDDVRLLLARMKRYPVPPQQRIGYAQAAKVYLH